MAKRVDANQPDIVRDLRKAGCEVLHLHTIGKGCPDILVGRHGVNYLLEIKDGAKPPSKRQLTDDEVEWHGKWPGQVSIVASTEEAYRVVGLL